MRGRARQSHPKSERPASAVRRQSRPASHRPPSAVRASVAPRIASPALGGPGVGRAPRHIARPRRSGRRSRPASHRPASAVRRCGDPWSFGVAAPGPGRVQPRDRPSSSDWCPRGPVAHLPRSRARMNIYVWLTSVRPGATEFDFSIARRASGETAAARKRQRTSSWQSSLLRQARHGRRQERILEPQARAN